MIEQGYTIENINICEDLLRKNQYDAVSKSIAIIYDGTGRGFHMTKAGKLKIKKTYCVQQAKSTKAS